MQIINFAIIPIRYPRIRAIRSYRTIRFNDRFLNLILIVQLMGDLYVTDLQYNHSYAVPCTSGPGDLQSPGPTSKMCPTGDGLGERPLIRSSI